MSPSDGRPLVSVCIPTYNGALYLREALDSALSQTVSRLEVLIVDDASTDATLAVAHEYAARDPRVRVHLNPRRLGFARNWNRCLELAEGHWIKFLFQDDSIAPECVERMHELGKRHGSLFVVCQRQLIVEEGVSAAAGEELRRYIADNNLTNSFGRGSKRIDAPAFAAHAIAHPDVNCIGEPTVVMLHRSVVERYGLFKTTLLFLTDWEYWMRVAVNGGLCLLDESLATFRLQPRGISLRTAERFGPNAERMDAIVLCRGMIHDEHYAPVRHAARQSDRPVDLEQRLLLETLRMRWRVRRLEDGEPEVAQAVAAHWHRITAEYAELSLPLWTCLARLAGLKLRRWRASGARRVRSVRAERPTTG